MTWKDLLFIRRRDGLSWEENWRNEILSRDWILMKRFSIL